MKKNDIKVRENNVLVEVMPEETIQNNIYTGAKGKSLRTETELYFGKIVGNTKKEVAIFNRLAGVVTPTEDCYSKVVPSSDILAFLNEKTKKIQPTQNRVLVRAKKINAISDDNVFNNEGLDPREYATEVGQVLAVGDDVNNLPNTAMAYYDPWCGTVVADVEGGEVLKIIYAHDILFYTV